MENENTRTLVLVHLGMNQTPVAPHRPGTYVCGYVAGDQTAAEDYLNTCKGEKINALVHNAFLVQIGIEFMPALELDPQGRPVRGPDGKPVIREGQMDVRQGFALMPLTKMDATNGCDYSVEAISWIYPRGTMIQDLESQMEATRNNLLHSRTGITTHPAGMPAGLRQ
jgi:hypothetical protein